MTEDQKLMIAVMKKQTVSAGEALSLGELASLCGVHPDLIKRFVALGLLEPLARKGRDDIYFAAGAVLTVKKICRLRHDLGINYAGIGLILDLLDKIEELEKELARMKTLVESFSCIETTS